MAINAVDHDPEARERLAFHDPNSFSDLCRISPAPLRGEHMVPLSTWH
jgi:hypothetical protein